MKLFEHPDFEQGNLRATEHFHNRGLRAAIIEKDYYVTEGMRLGIRQSYVYGIPGAVKTPASQRWMPLDPSLAKKLRQHQLRYASPANKEDWVFANPGTGEPYWPGKIQENWLVPAAEKVGMGRMGWHNIRHRHCSL